MAKRPLACALALVALSGCGSDWSDTETRSVAAHCAASGEFDPTRCAEIAATIRAESNCTPDQAKAVIDRIAAEYHGAPSLSVAENYELQGCTLAH